MQFKRPGECEEHQIFWDDNKISRLWNYYSRTPIYLNAYFSKAFGRQIIHQSGLPIKDKLDVLDFGCGPGFIWDHLVQLGANWQYSALDFSYDSIMKVKEKTSGYKNFKSAVHVESLPVEFPEAHFDILLLIEIVEHLNESNLDKTLVEAARLLKKGGVLLITTPNNEDLTKAQKFCPECGAIFHEWQHLRSWSKESLASRLKQYGFKLRMIKTLNFAAEDLTIRSVLLKLKQSAKRLLRGDPRMPHLIAVFQKN